MKIKITIPAQSLKIEIPAQEIEMDFQPIWEMEPPIDTPVVDPDPVVVELPPIIEEPVNQRPKDYIYLEDFQGTDLERLYQSLIKDGKILRFKDKTSYDFGGYKQFSDPTILCIVGKNSVAWVNKEDAQEIFLFTKDNPRFGSIGVNWLIKGDIEEKITQPTKALFRTVRDKVKTGMLAMISSHVPDDKTLGINLSRFIYSGSDSDSDFLYVIGKDITSNGPDFMQLKAPNGGNLYSVLENVKVNNPIVQFPATHKYNPTTIICKGVYDGERYRITSDNKVSQVLTWHGYQNGNIRTIINIGRFVWNISENDVIDDKIIILNNPTKDQSYKYEKLGDFTFQSDAEFQPGDFISFGIIETKQIGRIKNWSYKVDQKIDSDDLFLIDSSIDLPIDEILEASLTYKGNALIEIALNVNSNFNDWYITLSSGYGWTAYNEREITAYWKNVELTGFYRQSTSGVGSSKGYNLINSRIPKEDVIINGLSFISSNNYEVDFVSPLGYITKKEKFNDLTWIYTVKDSIYKKEFGIQGKEFDPKPLVQAEIPKEAKEFIDWLESLK